MTYVDTLDRFATGVEDDLARLREDTDPDVFGPLAATLLVAAVSRAVALADVALAAALSVLRGSPVAPVGLAVPGAAPAALVAAVRDLLTGPQYAADPARAVRVLARAEVLAAAQDAYSDGLVRHRVPGWTRVTNLGACAMCRDLTGAVLPADVPMYHHKGCGCVQRPVIERTPR